MVTSVLQTEGTSPQEGGKFRPLYKKGDHLQPRYWRPICRAIADVKLV